MQGKGYAVTRRDTEYSGHAKIIARDEDLAGFHCIATIGGDGTVHEVVNGMMLRAMLGKLAVENMPSLAIIPCGSGNTLAFDLGIATVADALKNIFRFRLRRTDVLELSAPDDSSFTSLQYVKAAAAPAEEGKKSGESDSKAAVDGAPADAKPTETVSIDAVATPPTLDVNIDTPTNAAETKVDDVLVNTAAPKTVAVATTECVLRAPCACHAAVKCGV